MVKKFISTVFAMVAFFSVNNASAQNLVNNFYKNDFQIGVYAGGRTYDKDAFGDYSKKFVYDENGVLYDAGLNLQYLRNLNNRLGLGTEMNLGFSGGDLENCHGERVGALRQMNASLMGVGRAYWINKDHFGLYSKIALGAEVTDRDVDLDNDVRTQENVSSDDLVGESHIRFAGKANPVAIEFGGKHVRAFVEPIVTFGNEIGVSLTAGAKFRF